MTEEERIEAWNNLVMSADPSAFSPGDKRRAAAITSIYMGSANNGGLNNFMTAAYDLDVDEVLVSLETLGALVAADQLRTVLDKLGQPLPASTQDERWKRLDGLWTDELDKYDSLSGDADQDLTAALERHLEEYADFYLRRGEY